MENDLYRSQKNLWKMIGWQRKYFNEFVRINDITEEQWTPHTVLWRSKISRHQRARERES